MRGLLLTGRRAAVPARGAHAANPSSLGPPAALHGEVSRPRTLVAPGKVAGRYLAPYLGTARPADMRAEPLLDRTPSAAGPAPDRDEALQLALLLAEEDARSGTIARRSMPSTRRCRPAAGCFRRSGPRAARAGSAN